MTFKTTRTCGMLDYRSQGYTFWLPFFLFLCLVIWELSEVGVVFQYKRCVDFVCMIARFQFELKKESKTWNQILLTLDELIKCLSHTHLAVVQGFERSFKWSAYWIISVHLWGSNKSQHKLYLIHACQHGRRWTEKLSASAWLVEAVCHLCAEVELALTEVFYLYETR